MRGITALGAALLVSWGPFVLAELVGGRAAVGSLSGGQMGDVLCAMLFVGAWTWGVFTSVPVGVGALVVALGDVNPYGEKAGFR